MARVRITHRLELPLASLPEAVVAELKEALTHANPAHHKARAMGVRGWQRIPATVKTWREEKRTGLLTLPRGATQSVRDVFERHGIEPEWEDGRTEGDGTVPPLRVTHRLTLWPHQVRVVESATRVENCLVRAPTGSGKSSAALALAASLGLPTLVMVWSSNLFDQWVERICAEYGVSKSSIGMLRGGKRSVAPITVAMQQTLNANPKLMARVAPAFGLVMADEVQRFAAKTLSHVIDAFPARYRIGFSADETRKDGMEPLIYDIFGRVAESVNQNALIAAGVVHDVEVRVVETKFTADWYVQAMSAWSTGRQTGLDPKLHTQLIEEMTLDEGRNAIALSLAEQEALKGRQVLLLSHRREHAVALARGMVARGITAGQLLGGASDGGDFAETVKRLKEKTWRAAAGTYQAIGQGLDLPSVDRGVATTPIASNRQFFGQVRGRICRTTDGKRDAVLWYLWDSRVFGVKPLVNLKAWNNRVTILRSGGELEDVSVEIKKWKAGEQR